jgi:hypothetical protein
MRLVSALATKYDKTDFKLFFEFHMCRYTQAACLPRTSAEPDPAAPASPAAREHQLELWADANRAAALAAQSQWR